MKFTQIELQKMSKGALEDIILILQERLENEKTLIPNQELIKNRNWYGIKDHGFYDDYHEVWFRYPTSNEIAILRDLDNQIKRIRLLREWSGCSLQSAKKCIETLFPNNKMKL